MTAQIGFVPPCIRVLGSTMTACPAIYPPLPYPSAACLGNGLSFSTFVSTVPVNGNRTVNRFALVRNLSGPLVNKAFNIDAWDKLAYDAMIKCASSYPPSPPQQCAPAENGSHHKVK